MPDGPLSPEEVAHRGFGTTFRGFDTGEVRAYLQRVANDLREATARERDLHRRLADAEYRAAHPVLEGDALTRSLGDEMGRVLATAQEAANGLKDKAEENAARILREAHDQAQRIRAQAEAILAVRTEEADAEAAGIRRAAQEEGAGVVERARREAAAAMADVEGKARQLVHDAQAARARVLGDLTRRRRLLQTQVEQLRAGRERLLEAYRKVRSTTDEVADELQRVEDEAREAAGAAGERVAAGAGDVFDDALAAFPAEPSAGGEGAADVAARPVPGGPAPESTGTTGPVAGAAAAGPGGAPAAAPVAPIAADVKLEVAAQVASQAAESAEAEAQAAEAATVEAAGEAGGSGVGNATQIVSTRPGASAERRPLRLLRRPKAEARPLDVMAVQSGDEAVRVIPPGSAAVGQSETATAGESDTVPAGDAGDAGGTAAEAEPHAAAPSATDAALAPQASEADLAAAAVAGVDELFARIRAGRADAVARAHEVMAADPGAPVQAADPPPGDPVEGDPAPEGPPGPVEEESLLRRRDTAVEGIEAKLARKLKRALQDEQNEVLDRLRSARAGVDPEAVLPSPAEQASRYERAADGLLRTSAAAGVGFVSPDEDARPETPDIDDVVTDLAASLAEPLRRALERALGGDGADQAAVGDRVGAAYRECKAQRIEGLAGDAVTAAFGRGTLAALPAGAASRWVVDDDGRPCPDCDDNALAGPTAAGEAFPTGQRHPPAHAGCRCLLAPAELAAAVAGPA